MAIIYTLQANPKWYLVSNAGQPLAPNGFIYTYDSQNRNVFKYAYKDSAGLFPWTDPIPVDANGTVGPIYWAFDSDNPESNYYIRVCKSQDTGDLVWDAVISGADGSGGGSITTALDLENLIANNVMYRNIGTVSPVPNFIKLAPSNHVGLTQTSANRGPDICFIKNTNTAFDTISFPEFPLGTTPLTGDVTPDCYLNYTCTNDPTGEIFKYIQFPISQKAKNLSGQVVSIVMWANLGIVSSANTLTLKLVQFFGDGASGSAEFPIPVASSTVTTGWTRLGPYNITIPSVAGKTVGECHNDGLFFQVHLPLGLACNINMTKPCMYLGNIAPNQDYHTYEMIESLVNSPRTGEVKISLNNDQSFGFVPMDDGTIGSLSSGASTRANFDTFPLYNLIWNSVLNTYAPVIGGRGSTSVADFMANKPIYLTRAVGRVFAGILSTTASETFTTNFAVSTSLLTVTSTGSMVTGYPVVLTTTGTLPAGLFANVTYYAIVVSGTTLRLASSLQNALAGTAVTFTTNGTGAHTIASAPYNLGAYTGEDFHAQTIAEMPAHTHNAAGTGGQFIVTGTGSVDNYGSGTETTGSQPATLSTGGGKPFNVIQPTTYMNIFIKL